MNISDVCGGRTTGACVIIIIISVYPIIHKHALLFVDIKSKLDAC